MTSQFPQILNNRPLDGAVAVLRRVSPTSAAALVAPSIDDAFQKVLHSCELWGGGSHLLVPEASIESSNGMWVSLLNHAHPDVYLGKQPTALATAAGHHAPAPLVVVLASLIDQGKKYPPVRLPQLELEDPWSVGYMAVTGALPDIPTPGLIESNPLREDIRYDELITIVKESVGGSPGDLITRVRDFQTSLAPHLTTVGLVLEAPRATITWRDGVIPSAMLRASELGPNLVVPYKPGSVEDLCLIWNLRAINGWPRGLPLGVPITENVVEVVRGWAAQHAWYGRPFGLRPGPSNALVSMTVSSEQLDHWAEELGADWTTVQARELLRPATTPCRTSTDIVIFSEGKAWAANWGPEDIRTFGNNYSWLDALGTKSKFRPLSRELPPSRSLAVSYLNNGAWREGSWVVPVSSPSETCEVSWPLGWTVLEAVARDNGLRVRRSEPGIAAEALIERIGTVEETFPLSSPKVTSLLYRLGERSGMTWFRSKFNGVIAELKNSESLALSDRSRVIAEKLDEISASTADRDFHSLTSDSLNLGSTEDNRAWLAWAEENGLLIRGVELDCPICHLTRWAQVAELAPPVVCPGCARATPYPYGSDSLVFRYRASELLLRVLQADSLGHILVLQWMVSLFRTGFDRPEELYGGYPGVEFLDRNGAVLGEADILLLFSDGTVALGEYKRSAVGMNRAEVDKLAAIADRINASWTFIATHDSAEMCSTIWRESQKRHPDRPQFALTAERLYRFPIARFNEDPFDWPEPGAEPPPGPLTSPSRMIESLREFRRPDGSIHSDWEYLDESSDP